MYNLNTEFLSKSFTGRYKMKLCEQVNRATKTRVYFADGVKISAEKYDELLCQYKTHEAISTEKGKLFTKYFVTVAN